MSETSPETKWEPQPYDLHYECRSDRRAALEQAVKMATAREMMDSDAILHVADKFFMWLQKNEDI